MSIINILLSLIVMLLFFNTIRKMTKNIDDSVLGSINIGMTCPTCRENLDIAIYGQSIIDKLKSNDYSITICTSCEREHKLNKLLNKKKYYLEQFKILVLREKTYKKLNNIIFSLVFLSLGIQLFIWFNYNITIIHISSIFLLIQWYISMKRRKWSMKKSPD